MDQHKKYIDDLQAGKVISHKFLLHNARSESEVIKLIIFALFQLQLDYMREVLTAFILEVVDNAVKANLKRIYFQNHNADINNSEAYQKLIGKFRDEVLVAPDKFEKELEKAGYFVEFSMQLASPGLKVTVINNCTITTEELSRIQGRIKRAAQYKGLQEAMVEIDGTEGGGLGLVMNVLLLKRTGIGVDAFHIDSQAEMTRAMLDMPRELNIPANVQKIHKEVQNTVKGIPTFPESINQILKLCDDPKSSLSQVSKTVERDPALAADILKLANSGGFITANKVATIPIAVSILGLTSIRQIAQASASRKIINKHFKIFQGFWEHSSQCAFYARHIAVKSGNQKIADKVYLAGLLHDLGKLVLHTLEPGVVEKIKSFTVNNTNINSSTLEEINLGVSHTDIGARIAQHWNFPDETVNAIRFHHFPTAANPEFRKEVSIIHMADIFLNVEEERALYNYANPEATYLLELQEEKQLENLHKYLKASYKEMLLEEAKDASNT